MSYKKRTYDTDEITLRKIFAKSYIDNTNIPAMRVLTADGAGSSYWGIPSTLGMNPSFNQINTPAGNFVSDLSYNIMTITTNNIGTAAGPGKNNLVLYNQSFNEIDISGNNTLLAFNSNTQQQQTSLRFAGTNGITIRSDSVTNTIYFDSIGVPVSTSLYSFQKARIENVSTNQLDFSTQTGYYLNAASPSSVLSFIGVGDIDLFADQYNNAILFTLNQSTGSVSTLTNIILGISTGYVTNTQYYTGIGVVSTIGYSNFSTGMSTSYGINSNLSITVFNLPFNQYTLLAQFNAGMTLQNNAVSTLSTNYTPLPALFSTSVGINNRITTFDIISSVSTVYIYGGNVSDFSASNVYYNNGDLSSFSTTIGGTINSMSVVTATLTSEVSTLSSLTLRGLSSLSTSFFVTIGSSLASTTIGLGSAGYISSASLYSTTVGLGTYGYLSSPSLYSSLVGLGTYGYVSSQTLYSSLAGVNNLLTNTKGLSTLSLSTGSLTTSTISFIDTVLNTPQLLAVSSGILQLNGSPITGGGGGSGGSGGIQFFSTSFTSTIYYRGTVPGGLNLTSLIDSCNASYQGYFNSAEIYFDTFSTYITSTTQLSLDYYYNLRLQHWHFRDTGDDTNANAANFGFSTGVLYNDMLDYTNVVTDIGVANIPSYTHINTSNTSTVIYYKNVISRRQRFQLSTLAIMTDYTTPVKVFHIIDSFYEDGDGTTTYSSGFSNYSCILNVNSTTALTISIQN
jgi:hypothetical protein